MNRDLTARREQIANEMASVPAENRYGIVDDIALRYRVSVKIAQTAADMLKDHA
jgi:hypothetical protein